MPESGVSDSGRSSLGPLPPTTSFPRGGDDKQEVGVGEGDCDVDIDVDIEEGLTTCDSKCDSNCDSKCDSTHICNSASR